MMKFFKNKKGQNVAEYAILIGLVVGGIIAIQTFIKRGLNARVKGAVAYMTDSSPELGTEAQYEPYYSKSTYETDRSSNEEQMVTNTGARTLSNTDTKRALDGSQESSYTSGGTVVTGMTLKSGGGTPGGEVPNPGNKDK